MSKMSVEIFCKHLFENESWIHSLSYLWTNDFYVFSVFGNQLSLVSEIKKRLVFSNFSACDRIRMKHEWEKWYLQLTFLFHSISRQQPISEDDTHPFLLTMVESLTKKFKVITLIHHELDQLWADECGFEELSEVDIETYIQTWQQVPNEKDLHTNWLQEKLTKYLP